MVGAGTRVRRATEVGLIVLFMGVLWLPLAVRGFGIDPKIVINENRALSARPELKPKRAYLATFPEKYEAYYSDHFGLRRALIYGLSLARLSLLGVSSSPHVVVGDQGWLYYTLEETGRDYPTFSPFSREDLQQLQRDLEIRRDWLARMGCRYLFVIAPDKQSIYPEYLPAHLQPRATVSTRMDQLVNHLKENSTLNLLDLRPPLRKARTAEQVYHRTDSHWNFRGAFVAVHEIESQLRLWFPDIPTLPRSALQAEIDHRRRGDLAGMLGLADRLSEDDLKVLPTQKRARPVPEEVALLNRLTHLQPMVTRIENPSLPRAVVLHDSFGEALVPFLSEYFQRTVFAPEDEFDVPLIERERPDVVIQVMVERKLGN